MAINEYQGARILLVEDEETLAVGLEFNLTDEGYFVKWAKDGRQAMELFRWQYLQDWSCPNVTDYSVELHSYR